MQSSSPKQPDPTKNVPSFLEEGTEELEDREYAFGDNFTLAIAYDGEGADHTPEATNAMMQAFTHEPCPCTGCPQQQMCAEERLACRDFYNYTRYDMPMFDGEREPGKPGDREPSRKGWEKINEGKAWRYD